MYGVLEKIISSHVLQIWSDLDIFRITSRSCPEVAISSAVRLCRLCSSCVSWQLPWCARCFPGRLGVTQQPISSPILCENASLVTLIHFHWGKSTVARQVQMLRVRVLPKVAATRDSGTSVGCPKCMAGCPQCYAAAQWRAGSVHWRVGGSIG